MQNLLCILNQGELLKCQKTPQAINEFTYFEARFILKASHISQWLKLIMSPHVPNHICQQTDIMEHHTADVCLILQTIGRVNMLNVHFFSLIRSNPQAKSQQTAGTL